MSTSKPVGQSYAGEQKRQFVSHFRRRFADGIFGKCPHKAYCFCSLKGKITKVSGKYPVKGKTLGKNKGDKRQDKRQQSSCKLTKFPDSPQIFRGELKIKKYRKRNKNTNHFGGWQNIGRKIFLEDLFVLPFFSGTIALTKVPLINSILEDLNITGFHKLWYA